MFSESNRTFVFTDKRYYVHKPITDYRGQFSAPNNFITNPLSCLFFYRFGQLFFCSIRLYVKKRLGFSVCSETVYFFVLLIKKCFALSIKDIKERKVTVTIGFFGKRPNPKVNRLILDGITFACSISRRFHFILFSDHCFSVMRSVLVCTECSWYTNRNTVKIIKQKYVHHLSVLRIKSMFFFIVIIIFESGQWKQNNYSEIKGRINTCYTILIINYFNNNVRVC